jgi:hypothetical protein
MIKIVHDFTSNYRPQDEADGSLGKIPDRPQLNLSVCPTEINNEIKR